MAKLIKDRTIADDHWILIRDTVEPHTIASWNEQNVIVPLTVWNAHREQLVGRKGKTGVWLQSHELPEAIGQDLSSLPLVALDFPVFSDGRAYSSARELRQNLQFGGELRAIGDVLCDQLFYMARCGFNAFALREDQNLEMALKRFEDFKDGYQASVDKPVPLFRRRV